MTTSAHPEPTPAVVKRLYARAFRCARPDCTRPLYKQDNDTGELVLNSRVAHIHARRAGGPRWIEMPSDDNRSEANLLLLCIEHSYEVDEVPDLYPAELLREWKLAQLDEHERAQRGWPMTDADAGRVLEASSKALVRHHAEAVIGAVRAAERFALTARRARTGPATQAAAWQAVRLSARSSFFGWDDDGNPVYTQPSRQETERCKAALLHALVEAAGSLSPLADAVKVELAAVRASRPAVEQWSAWVSRAVDEVIAASSTWPGPPGLKDDDRLGDALTGLVQAADALTAAWRGDPVSPPPPEPEPDQPLIASDPLKEHRALLDRARPYSRVDHRPYDPALREELAAAAAQAAAIPPVPSALGVGLSTTCGLAAAVAGNAKDEELAALAEQDSHRRPLSVAVLLLAEAGRIARNRGREMAYAQAESVLAGLWNAVDWSDPASWNPNDANIRSVHEHGCRVTSPEHVRKRLSQALMDQPDILLPMVAACAAWEERRNREDWSLTAIRRRYHDIPVWFPATAIVSAATSADPSSASIAVDDFGETVNDDPASLLAQVLWHARRASP